MEKIKDAAVMILFGAFILLGAYQRDVKINVPENYVLLSKTDLRKLNTRIQAINDYHDQKQVLKFFEDLK
jgi:hypothetical protein